MFEKRVFDPSTPVGSNPWRFESVNGVDSIEDGMTFIPDTDEDIHTGKFICHHSQVLVDHRHCMNHYDCSWFCDANQDDETDDTEYDLGGEG